MKRAVEQQTSTYTLAQALDLTASDRPQMVAFTGAGGKTSLMIGLAGVLPGKLVLTATTRMGREQVRYAAETLPAAVGRYPNLSPLRCTRISLVMGPDVEDDKVTGVDLTVPGRLLAQPDVSFVLVEADGARMLPVKAPAEHEPPIPPRANLVVSVAGIDALGRPISAAAHRPQRVAALLGKADSDHLHADDLAAILTHEQGGLKNVPPGARYIPAINKVEDQEQLHQARLAARGMLDNPRVQRVLIAAAEREQAVLEVQRRVTAVILAAGQSTRMGQPKLLLPWGNTSVLGQTIRNVQGSSVFDALVVSGAHADQVAAIAAEAGLPCLFNPAYATDEMVSSLQTAVAQLPPTIDGVLVVLGDQPLVEADIIDQLLVAFWQGRGDIIAPVFNGRRGNPVLIGRKHFDALLALPPGSAPRDLLRKAEVTLLPVASNAILQDIDSPQDYDRLRPH